MLFGRKKMEMKTFDREELYPVIHSSICTGEKVAGFKRRDNGKFMEIMLIRDEKDMEKFLTMYGLDRNEVKTEY